MAGTLATVKSSSRPPQRGSPRHLALEAVLGLTGDAMRWFAGPSRKRRDPGRKSTSRPSSPRSSPSSGTASGPVTRISSRSTTTGTGPTNQAAGIRPRNHGDVDVILALERMVLVLAALTAQVTVEPAKRAASTPVGQVRSAGRRWEPRVGQPECAAPADPSCVATASATAAATAAGRHRRPVERTEHVDRPGAARSPRTSTRTAPVPPSGSVGQSIGSRAVSRSRRVALARADTRCDAGEGGYEEQRVGAGRLGSSRAAPIGSGNQHSSRPIHPGDRTSRSSSQPTAVLPSGPVVLAGAGWSTGAVLGHVDLVHPVEVGGGVARPAGR